MSNFLNISLSLVSVKRLLLVVALFLSIFSGLSAVSNAQTDEGTNQDLTAPENTVPEPGTPLAQTKYVLFVREGCPHCAKVKEFISSNNLGANVEYVETLNNPNNQERMRLEEERVGIAENQQGAVPFMAFDNGDYLRGDRDIVEFLADRYDVVVPDGLQDGTSTYKSSPADYALLGFGALVLVGIIGYGGYTLLFDKKGK